VTFKDLKKSLSPIPSIARKITAVPLKTHRTADPNEIAEILVSRNIPTSISTSITTASRKLIDSAGSDDIIIVCGSHYGVGEFIANQERIYADKKRK